MLYFLRKVKGRDKEDRIQRDGERVCLQEKKA